MKVLGYIMLIIAAMSAIPALKGFFKGLKKSPEKGFQAGYLFMAVIMLIVVYLLVKYGLRFINE